VGRVSPIAPPATRHYLRIWTRRDRRREFGLRRRWTWQVAHKVYLVSVTPLTGDPILVDKMKSSGKVELLTEYSTKRIIGQRVVEGVEIQGLDDKTPRRLDVQGVFIEIGLLPNSDLVVDTSMSTRPRDPRRLCVPDGNCRVFAAGDVTDVPSSR